MQGTNDDEDRVILVENSCVARHTQDLARSIIELIGAFCTHQPNLMYSSRRITSLSMSLTLHNDVIQTLASFVIITVV